MVDIVIRMFTVVIVVVVEVEDLGAVAALTHEGVVVFTLRRAAVILNERCRLRRGRRVGRRGRGGGIRSVSTIVLIFPADVVVVIIVV